MDPEKDWFKIVISLLGLAGVLWMMYSRKNDEVLKTILKNQQVNINRIESNDKEDKKEIKKLQEQNATDIKTLSSLMTTTCNKFDNMADESRAERKQLQKANELKDKHIGILETKVESAEKMAEYQKEEFESRMQDIVDINQKVYKSLGIYGKDNTSSKTG